MQNENRLRILDDVVTKTADVHRLCRIVARHDFDLARQIRRAVTSVGLNAAEAVGARDGNRRLRLETAMTSGRETISGLRIAAAAGDLPAEQVAREVDALDRIVATLYRLTYRR